jgi:transcriptional regulator with XRE-family HTH domain
MKEVSMESQTTMGNVMARKARSRREREADTELGRRLAQLRKDRDYTQAELAQKMDIVQGLISDYELGKLRPHPEMLMRFAKTLQVSTDEILGLEPLSTKPDRPKTRRFVRRLLSIDKLPKRDQEALLRTIDAFLAARRAG